MGSVPAGGVPTGEDAAVDVHLVPPSPALPALCHWGYTPWDDRRGAVHPTDMREKEPEHPAAPEQVEHGFDEGLGRRPRPKKQRRVGRFSEGVEHDPDSALERGRFSEGVEQHPDDDANAAERRFSEGTERDRNDKA